MIEIKQTKWEDLDIRALAEITTEVRNHEGLGDYTIDQVEDYLRNMNERFPIEITLLAIEGEQILGWMGIERATTNIGEVGRWQPFVIKKSNRDEVAHELISELNSYAMKNGMSRMGIGFGGIDGNNLSTFEQRQSWYESAGWNKLDDNFFMAVNPMEKSVEESDLPGGVKLRQLQEVDNDTLFHCYHKAFTSGQATWIYDMSEEEKRQEFDKSFDRSQKINEPASLVVEMDGEIVGFILVKTRSDEEEHLDSIGVHPIARGKGLGKLMLGRVLNILRSQNVDNLSLGVDPVNIPAVRLYEKFGFGLVSRTVNYSWKVNS